MFADYHIHTEFSDDSVYPMEQVVKDAIAMRMDEICFTDHVDYGIKDDWDSPSPVLYRGEYPLANVDYPAYIAEIRELQAAYAGQITVKTGLEFGMQVHTIPQYEALFDKYSFDFIILSVHQVEDKEFWTQDFQRGRSQKEYKDTTPSKEILKLYRKMGGEIVTIGSDSHEPEHLGAYFEEAKQILRDLGFPYYCTYDKMEPIYHTL